VTSLKTGSILYLCYGAATINTYQGNDTGTWNSAYKVIQHFGNSTVLDISDSTGINSITNHSIAASAGQIRGGASGFNGGANATYLDLGSNAAIKSSTLTYSIWINPTNVSSPGTIFGSSTESGGPQFRVASGILTFLQQNVDGIGSSGAVP